MTPKTKALENACENVFSSARIAKMRTNAFAIAIGTRIAKIAHSCSRFSVSERAKRRGKNDDSSVLK